MPNNPALDFVPAKTPWLAKKIFSRYTWDIPVADKELYLTFDDGPTPEITDWTLDVLKDFNAKATFFCIGNNIDKHPDIFKRVVSHGHAIGNHTYNHQKGWKTPIEDYVTNVLKAQEIINSNNQGLIDVDPDPETKNLFRPPYGQITSKQGKSLIALGYKIIMWDVLAFDWKDTITHEKCLKNVVTTAQPGSIVVFHDSVKAAPRMQYALPKVLEHFSERGFGFKRIPE